MSEVWGKGLRDDVIDFSANRRRHEADDPLEPSVSGPLFQPDEPDHDGLGRGCGRVHQEGPGQVLEVFQLQGDERDRQRRSRNLSPDTSDAKPGSQNVNPKLVGRSSRVV